MKKFYYTLFAILILLIAYDAYAMQCGPSTSVYMPDGRLLTCQTCGTITTCY